MRAALAGLCGLAACSSNHEILSYPALDGVTSTLFVELDGRGVPTVIAFDGQQPGPLYRSGDLAILQYEGTLTALDMTLDATGTLILADEGRSLPLPARWMEVEAGKLVVRPIDAPAFDQRFARIRLPRAACPTFDRPTPSEQQPVDRLDYITLAAGLTGDRVLVGNAGDSLDAQAGALRIFEPGAEPLTLTATTTNVGFYGFALPSGVVWYTSRQGSEARLCSVRDGIMPACRRVEIGSLFAPTAVAGQEVDGHVELLAMNADGTLLLWREIDDAWRIVKQNEVAAGCLGASRILILDGPRRGIAHFPGGPIERFTLDEQGTGTFEPLVEGTKDTYCRSAYAKFPEGGELLVVVRPPLDPEVHELLWRPAGSSRFVEVHNDSLVEALQLVVVGNSVVASAAARGLQFLDVDRHRLDLPPRVCPDLPLLLIPDAIVPLGPRRLFLGGRQKINRGGFVLFADI